MRKIFLVLIIALTAVIFRINFKLHSEQPGKQETVKDIVLQLNFLESELKENGLATRMQKIFPEGYVFSYALYGLAWCELAYSDSEKDFIRQRAITEALFAYDRIDNQEARVSFQADLEPEYGIFYCGWRNYLLSKIIGLDSLFDNSDQYLKKFKEQSYQIAHAFEYSRMPYLETYKNDIWPGDSFVAMASLSNYDKALGKKFKPIIDRWIYWVKHSLDRETRMFPHAVNHINGNSIQGSRGSSMALMLRMMGEIDPHAADDQFRLFEDNFVSETFDLPSVREYPSGQISKGDIDSGPVIFGVGFTATIVSISTLAIYGKQQQAYNQFLTVQAFGFDWKSRNTKRYLLGSLPIADAFIAWGRASALNYYDPYKKTTDSDYFLKFRLKSFSIILILWFLFFVSGFFTKSLKKFLLSRRGRVLI